MFKFLKSKHKGLYVKLAFKYGMTPDHVRKLAHGKEYVNDKEKKVHDALKDVGLVHRSHHHEEEY